VLIKNETLRQKRNFNFPIENFPFIYSNFPGVRPYGIMEYLSLNWHEIPVLEETVRMFIILDCCKDFYWLSWSLRFKSLMVVVMVWILNICVTDYVCRSQNPALLSSIVISHWICG